MVTIVQSQLTRLVQSCYLGSASRSVAHLCTRFLSQCVEYAKHTDMAGVFTVTLLHCLLDALPQVISIQSAGALKWYFTLLNRVKCVDISKTAESVADLLAMVSRHYSHRVNNWHDLLKSRYGLFGNPFDSDLYDVEVPSQSKLSNVGAVTYASLLNAGTAGAGSGVTTAQDEVDDTELLQIGSKASLSGKLHSDLLTRNVFGLLEVEPLHYTCTATSDGTRLERLDVGQSSAAAGAHPSAFTGGTVNFGENLPAVIGTMEQEVSKLKQQNLYLQKVKFLIVS